MRPTSLLRLPWSRSPHLAPGKALNTYLVVAHDSTAPGALQRRLAVREQHLADARVGKQHGTIVLGGALLSRDFSELGSAGPAGSMAGSALLVKAQSLDEVRERLNADVYVTSGVFDASRISIYPFQQAMADTASTPAPTVHFSALDADAALADSIAARAAAAASGTPPPSLGFENPRAPLAELRPKKVKKSASRGAAQKAAVSLGQLREKPAAPVTLQGLRSMSTQPKNPVTLQGLRAMSTNA